MLLAYYHRVHVRVGSLRLAAGFRNLSGLVNGMGALHLGVQSGAIWVVGRMAICPTHREGTRTCTEPTNGLGHCTEPTTPKSTPRATGSWYPENTLVASRWSHL